MLKEFFIYYFVLFILLSLHVFWVPHVCLVLAEIRRVSGLLEMEMVVSSHVGAGS